MMDEFEYKNRLQVKKNELQRKKVAMYNLKNKDDYRLSLISYGKRMFNGRKMDVERVDCNSKRKSASVEQCKAVENKIQTVEGKYLEMEREGTKIYATDKFEATKRMMNDVLMKGKKEKGFVRHRMSSKN